MTPLDAPFDTRPADWLGYDEARARILAEARPLPAEPVSVLAARGRVLAAPLTAPFRLPPWDNSAMDGYAVRAHDLDPQDPTPLVVVGESRAGGPTVGPLGAGQAIRIMTGAPVPPGADAVVRAEDTHLDGEHLVVERAVAAGRNIRRGGEDFEAGASIGEVGALLTPARIALLVAAGCTEIPVHRRPRVSVLTSGDELLPPGSVDAVRQGHGVIDSNSAMLVAQAREAGAEAASTLALPDRADALRAGIERACAGTDLLVTVGGASVGAHDLFKRVLDGMGYRPSFWRIRMRPGSPVSFGHLPGPDGPVAVLGLPGNPSSAFVTFELFGRPYLEALAGLRQPGPRTARARAGVALVGASGLTVFARVRVRDDGAERVVEPTGPQGSGLISPLASADALALIPPDPGRIAAGAPCDILWLGRSPGAPDA